MRLTRLILLCAALMAGWAPSARAQLFLKLDGVTNSSAVDGYRQWMEIDSLQTGLGRSITAGASGGGASKPSFSEITIRKRIGVESPQLALLAAGGGGSGAGGLIPNGTVDMLRPVQNGSTRYLRLNLTNILISSLSQSLDGEDVGSEVITLAPLIVSWTQTLYNESTGRSTGNAVSLWDIQARTVRVGTNAPVFVSSGIRVGGRFELSWSGVAGRTYRIYAVTDLGKPFELVAEVKVETSGRTLYSITPTAPVMFYTVEQVGEVK